MKKRKKFYLFITFLAVLISCIFLIKAVNSEQVFNIDTKTILPPPSGSPPAVDEPSLVPSYSPPVCIPNCKNPDGTLKHCGDNGCGGSCGSCDAGACKNGICIQPTIPQCTEIQKNGIKNSKYLQDYINPIACGTWAWKDKSGKVSVKCDYGDCPGGEKCVKGVCPAENKKNICTIDSKTGNYAIGKTDEDGVTKITSVCSSCETCVPAGTDVCSDVGDETGQSSSVIYSSDSPITCSADSSMEGESCSDVIQPTISCATDSSGKQSCSCDSGSAYSKSVCEKGKCVKKDVKPDCSSPENNCPANSNSNSFADAVNSPEMKQFTDAIKKSECDRIKGEIEELYNKYPYKNVKKRYLFSTIESASSDVKDNILKRIELSIQSKYFCTKIIASDPGYITYLHDDNIQSSSDVIYMMMELCYNDKYKNSKPSREQCTKASILFADLEKHKAEIGYYNYLTPPVATDSTKDAINQARASLSRIFWDLKNIKGSESLQAKIEAKIAEINFASARLYMKDPCKYSDFYQGFQQGLNALHYAEQYAPESEREFYRKALLEAKTDMIDMMIMGVDNSIKSGVDYIKPFFPEDLQQAINGATGFKCVMRIIDYGLRSGPGAREFNSFYFRPGEINRRITDVYNSDDKEELIRAKTAQLLEIRKGLEDAKTLLQSGQLENFCKAKQIDRLQILNQFKNIGMDNADIPECNRKIGSFSRYSKKPSYPCNAMDFYNSPAGTSQKCNQLLDELYRLNNICGFSDIQLLMGNGYANVQDNVVNNAGAPVLGAKVKGFKFVGSCSTNGAFWSSGSSDNQHAYLQDYPYSMFTPQEQKDIENTLNNQNLVHYTAETMNVVFSVSIAGALTKVRNAGQVVRILTDVTLFGAAVAEADYAFKEVDPQSGQIASDISNIVIAIAFLPRAKSEGGQTKIYNNNGNIEANIVFPNKAKLNDFVSKNKLTKISDGVYRDPLTGRTVRITDSPAGIEIQLPEGTLEKLGEKVAGENGCFLANTKILVNDESLNATGNKNSKLIQDIKIGDSVLSYDINLKKNVYVKVTNIFYFWRNDYYIIKNNLSDDEIKVTPEHPFYVNSYWVLVKDLRVGDELLTDSGKKAKIISIEKIHTDNPFEVYNLEVDGAHTYYANGVLVHNKPDFKIDPDYRTFGEELAKIRESDPALYDLTNYWRRGCMDVPTRSEIVQGLKQMESNIRRVELEAVKKALKGLKETSIKLPNAENEISWSNDDMIKWTENHGSSSPKIRIDPGGRVIDNTRFDNPTNFC